MTFSDLLTLNDLAKYSVTRSIVRSGLPATSELLVTHNFLPVEFDGIYHE